MTSAWRGVVLAVAAVVLTACGTHLDPERAVRPGQDGAVAPAAR